MLTVSGASIMRFKADLQIHTVCSDGKSTGEDVVRHALIKGVRIVAPTDHNTFKGYKIVREAVEKINASMIVIAGNEVRTDLGELIILCENPLPDEIVPRRAVELIDFAHERNCIVYAPHPYDPLRLGVKDMIRKLEIDAIEIFNASAPPWSNKKAYKTAKEMGRTMLANSDAHVPDFIGSAYNIIEIENLRAEDVLEEIRKNRVIPVPGRPSLVAYIKDALHSIALRMNKNYPRELCSRSR